MFGWMRRKPAPPVEITPDQLDRMMVAYRRGACMTEWEECITHSADRTLTGLRFALTEIGITVIRRG